MATGLPGPAGWRDQGRHTLDSYGAALERLEKLERWARDHALGDPAARAVWLVIARADLQGELLTAAELVRRSGVTRYLGTRFLRRAVAQGLVEAGPAKYNAKHTGVCLTTEGRQYLIGALDDFIADHMRT